ncbi:MAG: tripartite tricarboxylate transporter permease [Bacteroidetes bacterium]|nr:tripartite tricarboxylate transporter permease [Bacteroidota bacterium]
MLEVFANILTLQNLMLVFIGVAVGNLFGCIPGLNAPIAVALAIPITFTLEVLPSVCLLMGLYMGCVSGGLVSAILLRIPGTAASVATTFDGYPMAQQGRGTEALSYGAFASFFGGIFSCIFLLTLAPVLANIAIGFGPWEYFGTATLSLVLVCVLMNGRVLKGLIAVCIGLLLKTVGMSPVDGVAARFSFGNYNLENGFNLIVVIIGVFALPEILNSIGKIKNIIKPVKIRKRIFYVPKGKDIRENLGTMLKGSFLGTIIGILPGMGGGAASLVSYAQAKRTSKTPEKFGTGCAEGIFCCESANNATTGGALIPMLALGVPGDTTTAIIMGALTLQGISAGPLLSMNQPILFRSIIFSVFVANIFMFLYQILTIKYMAKIIEVPKYYLFPIISMFCVTGVISLNNNTFELLYLMGFVIIGYILDKNKYPISPFILAFVLGGIIEDNLRRSIIYYGSFIQSMQQVSIGTLFIYFAAALIIFSAVSSNKQLKEKLRFRRPKSGDRS